MFFDFCWGYFLAQMRVPLQPWHHFRDAIPPWNASMALRKAALSKLLLSATWETWQINKTLVLTHLEEKLPIVKFQSWLHIFLVKFPCPKLTPHLYRKVAICLVNITLSRDRAYAFRPPLLSKSTEHLAKLLFFDPVCIDALSHTIFFERFLSHCL